MKNFDCRECPGYGQCATLCDKAEEYVNQDYVKYEELYLDREIIDTMIDDRWVERLAESIPLTRTERKICTLLGYGLCRKDIAKLMKIARETVRSHIRNIKAKTQ